MNHQYNDYTHPDVLTLGVAQGWAEAETDPARIDWAERQARAAIPFEVVDGRPVNPCEKTGITRGRNEMGRWGEQQMADALVAMSTRSRGAAGTTTWSLVTRAGRTSTSAWTGRTGRPSTSATTRAGIPMPG
jgi:hypothetical protein